MTSRKKKNFGERLIRAAREACAIARGEADPSTCRVFVPADVDVDAPRREQGSTEEEFAARYGLPIATVRDRKQNPMVARRRRPRPDKPD